MIFRTLFTFLLFSFLIPTTWSQSDNTIIDNQENEDIFRVVEEMPRFPGCEELDDFNEKQTCSQKRLLEFIYSNLKYPEEDKEYEIEGSVVVQFVIEKDGTTTNIKCVRKISPSSSEECLRIVNIMASSIKWIPGKQRGRDVRVQFTLPIKFKLEGSSTPKKKNIKAWSQKQRKKKEGNTSIRFNLSDRDTMEVHRVVDEMPRFPGCEDYISLSHKNSCSQKQLDQFIEENLIYPDDATKKKIEGTAVIQFVVEKDGSITNIKCVREVYPSIGKESLDIVQFMANTVTWIPGKKWNKKVRVQYTLPIKFKLETE